MSKLSRRDVLTGFGLAGVGALLDAKLVSASDVPIRIGERSAEIAIREVSSSTIRISIVPLENGQPTSIESDGSLVQPFLPPPKVRFATRSSAQTVRCGDVVVKLTFDPLVIHIEAKDGSQVQQL